MVFEKKNQEDDILKYVMEAQITSTVRGNRYQKFQIPFSNEMLSQSVADNILSMITIERRFSVGDKLPNELDLSEELNVNKKI